LTPRQFFVVAGARHFYQIPPIYVQQCFVGQVGELAPEILRTHFHHVPPELG